MSYQTPGYSYYLTGLPQLGTAVGQGLTDFFNSTPMRTATGAARGALDMVNPIPDIQSAVGRVRQDGFGALAQPGFYADVAFAGLGLYPPAKAGSTALRIGVREGGDILRRWYGGKVGTGVLATGAALGAGAGYESKPQPMVPSTPAVSPATANTNVQSLFNQAVSSRNANPFDIDTPYQQFLQAALAGQKQNATSVPMGMAELGWNLTRQQSIAQGLIKPEEAKLTPSEIIAIEQARKDLQSQYAQANAISSLQEKQQRAGVNERVQDIRQFMTGAEQDAAAQTAALGPAAELGLERSLEGAGGEQISDIRQSLADWLAMEKLQRKQRGATAGRKLQDIKEAEAAELLTRSNEITDFYRKAMGL